MATPPPPPFGKRSTPARPRAARTGTRTFETRPEQRAFFAEARRNEEAAARPAAVPRSAKAAFLAGLVVGCGLAGFDVTGTAGLAKLHAVTDALSGHLGVTVDTGVLNPTVLVPATMLLGLLGGARAAAMTVLPVHWLLARAGWTGHGAYAAGGAGATTLVAAALLLALGQAPVHGWMVEVAAGAACGVLYRVFAGVGRR